MVRGLGAGHLGFSLRVVVWAVRMNCCGRFGFCGCTVLLACRGDQVSFNTTVGGVLLKDRLKGARLVQLSGAKQLVLMKRYRCSIKLVHLMSNR